jgi:hypothetical protein
MAIVPKIRFPNNFRQMLANKIYEKITRYAEIFGNGFGGLSNGKRGNNAVRRLTMDIFHIYRSLQGLFLYNGLK